MAYFNHAFCKGFLATSHLADTTKTSADLGTVGQVAFIDSGFKVMNALGVAAHAGGFYIAQASFQTNDKIGNNPGMGGYAESSKSKMIQKKYISDMWISGCEDETAPIAVMEFKNTRRQAITSNVGFSESCFPCGTDPIFRVDIKGTAALRFLNHNAYGSLNGSLPLPRAGATLPANGVDMCCATQGATTVGSDTVTHSGIPISIVAMNLRDQFNGDPILSQFGTAELWVSQTDANNGGGSATTVYHLVADGSANETAIYAGGGLGVRSATNANTAPVLTAIAANAEGTANGIVSANDYRVVIRMKSSCELQTQFSDCSFDTRDFYLMGGLKAIISLQDETGVPCVPCQGFVESDGLATATDGGGGATTPNPADFKQRRTSAETAARDILLTERYKQNMYNQGNKDSARFREIEQMAGIVTAVGRDGTSAACRGKYRVYNLLHSVPRFNNPSGTFDNDQYLYRVYVPCTGATSVITSLNADWLAIAIDAGVMKFDGSGIVGSVADLIEKGGDY